MCYEITSRPVKPVLAFLALVRLKRHAEALARSPHGAFDLSEEWRAAVDETENYIASIALAS